MLPRKGIVEAVAAYTVARKSASVVGDGPGLAPGGSGVGSGVGTSVGAASGSRLELMSALVVAAASALMLVRAAALVSAVRLDQASGLGRLSWLW